MPFRFDANDDLSGLDPHHGNVGIAVPQINQFNGFDLMDHIGGELEMSPVIPIRTSYPMESVPAYMVGVVSIFGFLRAQNTFPTNDRQDIRILDFGRGKFDSKNEICQMPMFGCNRHLHAATSFLD